MNRVSDDYKKLHPAVHALVDKVDDFLAFKKNLKELRLCIGKQNSLYKTLDQLEGALAGHVILITDIKNGTSNIAYDALRDFLIDADRYDVMHQNIYNVLFSKNGIVACLHRLADHEDFKNSNEGNIPQILADFAYAHLKPVLENPDIMAGLQHFADNKTTIRRPVFAKSEGFHQQCIALHKEVGHILDNCNLMERHLPLLGLAPDRC